MICSSDQNTMLWGDRVQVCLCAQLRKASWVKIVPQHPYQHGCGEICVLNQGLSTGKQQLLWKAGREHCNYQWEEPDSSNNLNTCLPHTVSSTLPYPTHQYLVFSPPTYYTNTVRRHILLLALTNLISLIDGTEWFISKGVKNSFCKWLLNDFIWNIMFNGGGEF